MALMNFKKAAQSIFGGGEELDRILALPMTQLRLELKLAWQDQKFSQPQFDAFVEKLAKVGDLGAQAEVAAGAIEKQAVDSELDIELNTPAKQLLWAATVTRLMDVRTEKKEGPVGNSALWKQLLGTIGLHNEAITVSKMLSASIQNDSVTFAWGQPGSWFYQDPAKNHLNFDVYFMLLAGFEHIRSVEGHEVGHSQLSTGYPPRMQELYDKVKKYIDPRTVDGAGAEAPPKMTKKDQVDLAGEVAEWNLWHRAWNAMEDICVDQFAINLRRTLQQDYGDSLNNAAMVLRGYGEILRGDDLKKLVPVTTNMPAPAGRSPKDILEQMLKDHAEAEQKKKIEEKIKSLTTPLSPQDIADIKAGKISPLIAEKMYDEIPKASLLSGYVTNGLFSDKDKNWERFRVFADDIRKTVDVSKIPEAKGMDAFQYLVYLSTEAKESIRTLQPEPKDRILLRAPHTNIEDSYKAVVAETTKKRGLVMQQIWDVYIKPYADVLLQEFKKQVEKNLDKQQQQGNQKGNQKGNQQGNQQGQPQSGGGGQPDPNGQPQSGGGGQPDPNGQPQSGGQPDPNGQSGGGKPDPNGKQQKGGGKGGDKDQKAGDKDDKDQQSGGGDGANDNQQDPQDLDQSLKDQIKNMAETPAEKEEKDAKAEQEAGQGQGKDGQQQDGEPKEGEGKDGEGKDGQGQEGGDKNDAGTSGWGQDKNQQQNPIRVGDMKDKSVVKEDLTPEEKEAMKQAAKSMPNMDPNGVSSQAGHGRGVDLARLAKGDWRDFNRRCMELAPVINRVAESYKKIKKEQRRQILQQSKQLDYIPPDGDIQGRLDKDKMIETKFRKAAKQKMTLEDAKKFQDDHIATSECAIEIVAMIDGSGSMPGVQLGNGVTAMEAAMQSAVINYMACRQAGIDAYIVMWGDSEPIIIATPDTPLKEVGEKVETLRRGTGSGTSLAPGIVATVKSISERKNKPGTISGSTHLLVYSDGDIGDPVQTVQKLGIISGNAKNLSVDVAVLRASGESYTTSMEDCFQQAIDKTGGKLVGKLRGNNPSEIPLELARLMLKRVRSFKVKAEPDSEKRRRLKQLYRKLGGPDG